MEPVSVSTKRERIAELARQNPAMVFTSLNHHLDEEWLRYAYELTRKDGAVGIDGRTAAQYEENLEENLRSLLERIKSGRYHAPPVRRAYIPKADGTKRPLGIPTFEDKVAQRAIVLLLEPIYEQTFSDCSFGFRPGRSAHQALQHLRSRIMETSGRWVLDVDLRRYFEASSHYTPCIVRAVEQIRKGIRYANSQAFSSPRAYVNRLELAALNTLQHRLA